MGCCPGKRVGAWNPGKQCCAFSWPLIFPVTTLWADHVVSRSLPVGPAEKPESQNTDPQESGKLLATQSRASKPSDGTGRAPTEASVVLWSFTNAQEFKGQQREPRFHIRRSQGHLEEKGTA